MVKEGQDALYTSRDSSPEVLIPGSAIAGQGWLQVSARDLEEGRKGWEISLTGAELIGKATITFRNALISGRPAPLIGYREKPSDAVTYVQNARISGNDIIAETDHFSTWFTDSLDWLRSEMDRISANAGTGEQPSCEGEAQARTNLEVQSDAGAAARWCLGQDRTGLNVLRVNNSRSYAVSMVHTPALSLITRSLPSFGDVVPNLIAKEVTPIDNGNVIDIVGPGETVEYAVGATGTARLRVDPSPSAYLATVIWFAAETAEMIYSRIYKDDVTIKRVGNAMASANCLSSSQAVITADVSNSEKAAKFLTDAYDLAMACTKQALDDMAREGGADEIFLTTVAEVFSWLWSGMRTSAAGFGGAIDALLNMDGYVITLFRNASGSTPAPRAPSLPLGDIAELAGNWKGPVIGQSYGYDLELGLQDLGGNLVGKVNYPQLNCGGTWTEEMREGNLIQFTEVIDRDPDKRCIKVVTAGLHRTAIGLHIDIRWGARQVTSELVRQ